MNFQPPPIVKDPSFNNSQRTLSMQINDYNSKLALKTDCSPLLRTASSSDGPSQKRNNFHNNRPYQPVHNRLGKRNQYSNNTNISTDINDKNGQFNNRKRLSDGSNNELSMPKRKWNNKRQHFYQNSNSYQRNTAQNRMNQLRNVQHDNDNIVIHNKLNEESSINPNDSQELDATDITVQVVNNLAGQTPRQETDYPERFKMILNPKCQAAIKVIQQKRKEKQVISPFPVVPHVTGITLHERFTLL